jgi:tetratricopeptide (TPR) repeat protein
LKASFSVNVERFTGWRLSYIPGIVKLWESPGKAGGLPKRNYQQAVNDYNKVLEAQPNDAQAYKNRGRAYFLLLNYQQAINDFDKVIELISDDAEAYFFREASREKSGDYQQAIKDFNKAAWLGHKAAKDMLKAKDIL